MTSVGTAFATNYGELLVLRFANGFFSSFLMPAAYSILTDYIPPEKRTLANSIYQLGVPLGNSVSILSIFLIQWFGWRVTYLIVGTSGVVLGFFACLYVKEPVVGKYDTTHKDKDETRASS